MGCRYRKRTSAASASRPIPGREKSPVRRCRFSCLANTGALARKTRRWMEMPHEEATASSSGSPSSLSEGSTLPSDSCCASGFSNAEERKSIKSDPSTELILTEKDKDEKKEKNRSDPKIEKHFSKNRKRKNTNPNPKRSNQHIFRVACSLVYFRSATFHLFFGPFFLERTKIVKERTKNRKERRMAEDFEGPIEDDKNNLMLEVMRSSTKLKLQQIEERNTLLQNQHKTVYDHIDKLTGRDRLQYLANY